MSFPTAPKQLSPYEFNDADTSYLKSEEGALVTLEKLQILLDSCVYQGTDPNDLKDLNQKLFTSIILGEEKIVDQLYQQFPDQVSVCKRMNYSRALNWSCQSAIVCNSALGACIEALVHSSENARKFAHRTALKKRFETENKSYLQISKRIIPGADLHGPIMLQSISPARDHKAVLRLWAEPEPDSYHETTPIAWAGERLALEGDKKNDWDVAKEVASLIKCTHLKNTQVKSARN